MNGCDQQAMREVQVQVAMTLLVEAEDQAVTVAQRWLPFRRELPLSCSDGVTLTSMEVRTGVVAVPREAVEHLLDWHNKTPCGAGYESYDEVIFDVLKAALPDA